MSERSRAPFGPDPEAFNTAFGVGAPGGGVHPVDGLGVTLASIQGLRQLVAEHADGLEELRARLNALERPGE